ncbi:hypothetical protein HW555_008574 [Spodoptera exigua]|uniref:Uncharacterized protein n=1 Tax=Spodoptera exigua TaxID=7107 RepID=A0A835GE38_SPOEX|nr:hypothetical protein HW555_008574 [Spodoptera exigua]
MSYGVLAMGCKTKESAEKLLKDMEEKHLKMSIKSFDELSAKLQDYLKHVNLFRAPVSPVERLAVTLSFV